MRGDRPEYDRGDGVGRPGCPACAGIDRCSAAFASPSSGLPRMRGDRPRSASIIGAVYAVAPHARG